MRRRSENHEGRNSHGEEENKQKQTICHRQYFINPASAKLFSPGRKIFEQNNFQFIKLKIVCGWWCNTVPITSATCFHSISCCSFFSFSSHLSSFLSIVFDTFSSILNTFGSIVSTEEWTTWYWFRNVVVSPLGSLSRSHLLCTLILLSDSPL